MTVAENKKILLGLRPEQGGVDSIFARDAGTTTALHFSSLLQQSHGLFRPCTTQA